jgi:hypothetical protein
MQLLTNTPYTLIALVDSESSGNNSVPEPSLFLMTGLGIGVLVASRSRLRHGSFKHRRNEYTQ